MTALKTPAADASAEDWGRCAVSIPGFCPRPGVVGTYRGQHAVFLGFDDRPERRGPWMIGPCSGEWAEDADPVWGDTCYLALSVRIDEFSIDPDDPATAGCLLALLGGGGYSLWASAHFNSRDIGIGRACIAYAAALGRWPGGAE